MTETIRKECDRCKQALEVVRVNDREIAYDSGTSYQHVCWDLPQDANLLVLEDD